MSIVTSHNESLAAKGFSSADLAALRAVNERIAIARTDPAKMSDNAWLCISAVY